MREQAIEYLKYLHALEIAAGMNFKAAFDDLYERGELLPPMAFDLQFARNDEMKHARMVREMLEILGYDNTSELMDMPRQIVERLSDGLPEPWPQGMEAYARIMFNRELETRLVEGGLNEFYVRMHQLLLHLPRIVRVPFIIAVGRFVSVVRVDEAWHVDVDERVLVLYERIHQGFDMKGLLDTVQVSLSPFKAVIRAKQAFVRGLSSPSPSALASASVEA